MITRLKIWAVVAFAAYLAVSAAYWVGRREGLGRAEASALQISIDTLRERKLTDEQIKGMSDADLCTALGGVLANGRCE